MRTRVLNLAAGLVILLDCHAERLTEGGTLIGGEPTPPPTAIAFPLRDAIVYPAKRYDPNWDLLRLDIKTLAKQRLRINGNHPRCPAIAQDGNAIAYVSDAGLTIETPAASKTVPAEGCPVWSPDGQRVATTLHSSGASLEHNLAVYSRDGALVGRQAANYQVAPNAWSPNGKDILYVACPLSSFPDCGGSAVGLVNADSLDHPRILGTGVGPASFSPDGSQVAYVCGGVCVISATGGAPRTIASGSQPRWSPAENRVALLCGGAICVSDSDGGNLQTLPVSTREAFRWSPDGKAILFVSEGRNTDLFAVSADGAKIVNLSRDRGLDDIGSWAPSADAISALNAPPISLPSSSAPLDPNDIVYQGVSVDLPRLWLIRADGSRNRLLFNAELPEQCATLSPDRTLVAFSSLGLWVAAVDGSGEVQIDDRVDATYLQGPDTCPVWSPNGRFLAWGHRYENLTAELRIADIETRQIQRLDSATRVSKPQWSADGTIIFYLRDVPNAQPGDYDRIWSVRMNGVPAPFGERNWTAVSSASDGRLALECGTSICVSGPNGENPATLTSGRSPLSSDDGKRIAFINGTALFVMQADGSGVRQLASMNGDPHWLSWSPDDASIAVEVDKNLWVVPTDGTSARMLPYAQLPSWTARRVY
jgi:Tol biopolymer transport system component